TICFERINRNRFDSVEKRKRQNPCIELFRIVCRCNAHGTQQHLNQQQIYYVTFLLIFIYFKMKSISIKGQERESVGKVATKAARNAGLVPCVIYGGDKPVHFTAEEKAFRNLVYTPNVH